MSTATANGNDDDFTTRNQQGMLASQRAKAENVPTEANRTGRFTGYFPLGYKEGFSQWVCYRLVLTIDDMLMNYSVGKCTGRQS